MIHVKICGLTRLNDALLAEELGADFLGFVFFRKSPRYISPSQCRQIIGRLDPLTRAVGVFVDEGTETIIAVARKLRLDWVQLHGNETGRQIMALKRAGLKVIKAFPVEGNRLPAIGKCPADLILFDSRVKGRFGGTGKVFDPRLLRKVGRHFFISGGLKAENIGEACRIARPYGLDLSSGVEDAPGVKSSKKMRALFRVIHEINGDR